MVDLFPHGEQTKVLLTTTGAESVENAIKIARQATRRPDVICYTGAFHGRTMMGMTLTSKVSYQRWCGPMADKSGNVCTLYVRAGAHTPRIVPRPPATNHQDGVVLRPYHIAVASYDREMFIANRLRDPAESVATMTRHFLDPPLFHRRYRQGFGTLYTALYHCEAGTLKLYLPNLQKTFSIDGITHEQFTITYQPSA